MNPCFESVYTQFSNRYIASQSVVNMPLRASAISRSICEFKSSLPRPVKLISDQARCDQASRRVQLQSEFKSPLPRSELNSLLTRLGATRLREEFNLPQSSSHRYHPLLALTGFVAQSFCRQLFLCSRCSPAHFNADQHNVGWLTCLLHGQFVQNSKE